MIKQFGTFDVENYGDLLYPVVFEKVLRQRYAEQSSSPVSFLADRAPQAAGYTTTAIKELFSTPSTHPYSLVIGGGDLLRQDWERVASHYRSRYLGQFQTSRSFQLTKPLQHLAGRNFGVIRHFRVRQMSYPGAGPFIVNPDRLGSNVAVAYCSCGVPFPLEPNLETRRAFDLAHFIYLRDQQSREKLQQVGVRQAIHVAPDLIVTLSDFFNPQVEAATGRQILQQWGVQTDRPILCFQSSPASLKTEATQVLEQLLQYRRQTDAEIVLLPLGYCHGDGEILQALASESQGALKYVGATSIFDIIAVIAASQTFVGTSLHGNITAFSFGIPQLFGPIAVDKVEGFLDSVGLPLELKLPSWSELLPRLQWLDRLEAGHFAPQLASAKQQTHAVLDQLFAALPLTSQTLNPNSATLCP